MDSQILSPRQNGVSLQPRNNTRTHNINTVKCTLCNNMVSSSSFNSHLVKCHNASAEQIKRMSVKTTPTNLPSSPEQNYSAVNNIVGQAYYQNETKIKFHTYVPEKDNSHGVVLKSENGSSPKSSNSSVKGSDWSPKQIQKSSLATTFDIQLSEAVKPVTIDGIIGQESAVNKMKQVLMEFNQANFCNVFITGPLGSGRSTLAGILKQFIETRIEAHFVEIGSGDSKEITRKIASNSKPVFLLLDNIHLLKSEQEETLAEILTRGHNVFLIATALESNISTLANSLTQKAEINLEKLTNKSIFKILENAKTYLKNFLDSKGCDNLDVTNDILDSIVSSCNGSTSNALSQLYRLVVLNDSSINYANSPNSDISPPNSNNQVGNIVLASLLTSVANMPKSPTSLSTTLTDIKNALNIKQKHNSSSNGLKQQNKNLGKRSSKVECSTTVPDAKRFLSSSFQPVQLNNVNQKLNIQPLKQEMQINGDLLKLCPVKYIPITTNGGTQTLSATSIHTPIFLTQPPISSPPLSAKSADKQILEPKSVILNGNSKTLDPQQLISIGGTTVQNDQGNLVWTLYFAMLTGNVDSALIVLSSLLQTGVKTLTIAQELLAFASLYIGLSDATALQTALLTYQACQSLPSTHAMIILTQLVLQLTKCNKSTETRDKYFQIQMQLARTQS
ncbi:ATPase AAA [Oopsacas minuta]|uniref:ATPase AAA n=1 Tax=Oopsacas minuta TaxID=111878 RepID=A0AAV7JYS0_9METZ|nr:ATPase AAA [Oopsacas minuta]